MLFLVSGASGVGKSTVREHLAPRLGHRFEAVELKDLGSLETVTLARRQELAEIAAQRAAALAGDGRHLLLSGDPVAPGEIVAAPSGPKVGGIAACILDLDEAAQRRRLAERGDPPEFLPLHLGFAAWMREHASDPGPRLDVLKASGSPIMRWDRLDTIRAGDPRWKVRLIDVSAFDRAEAAAAVLSWIEAVLADPSLAMHPQEWTGEALRPS